MTQTIDGLIVKINGRGIWFPIPLKINGNIRLNADVEELGLSEGSVYGMSLEEFEKMVRNKTRDIYRTEKGKQYPLDWIEVKPYRLKDKKQSYSIY